MFNLINIGERSGSGVPNIFNGMNVEKALKAIHKKVNAAGSAVYEVRVIHGGTRIRSAVRDEFGYGREPKVKRILPGDNEGITLLVLKELYYRNRFANPVIRFSPAIAGFYRRSLCSFR